MHRLTSVLAPVDLESLSWEPIDYAASLAATSGAIVDLLYVVPTNGRAERAVKPAHYDRFLTILAALTARFSNDASTAADPSLCTPIFVGHMQPGDVTELILDFALRCGHDVIVVGTHTRIGHVLPRRESITEQIVRRAQCPVLTVPTLRVDDLHEAHTLV